MKTRAILALSALLAAGLSAGVADAAVKKKPKPIICPSFTDAAKDDANADTGANEDPALDIIKTTQSVKAGILTVAIQVTKLGQSMNSDGVQYAGGFTGAGKAIEVFGTVSLTQPVVSQAFALTGINVDGSYVSGTSEKVTITQDAATNTVKITAAVADLEAAAGGKLAGQAFGGLQSNTFGTYGVLLEPYDESTPAGALKLTVADCT